MEGSTFFRDSIFLSLKAIFMYDVRSGWGLPKVNKWNKNLRIPDKIEPGGSYIFVDIICVWPPTESGVSQSIGHHMVGAIHM